MFVHEPWRAVAGLVHGFLDRRESGAGRPWAAALGACGVDAVVVTPAQVHGTRVARVDGAGSPGEADGVVTATAGIVVGVVTADCVPVLLRAVGRDGVGAVHAGWRGAAAGVVERGVAALCETAGVSPDRVEAAIGPAIGPCCYQVGDEVRAAFERRTNGLCDAAWTPDGRRWRLDLRAAVRRLLAAAGVERTAVVGPCTRCAATLLHSFRRDGPAAGRQLAFIGLG